MPYFPQNKITDTIWHDIDDLRAFKVLDLKEIEKMFSAYQRQQVRMIRLNAWFISVAVELRARVINLIDFLIFPCLLCD